jgi:hypothetical protein
VGLQRHCVDPGQGGEAVFFRADVGDDDARQALMDFPLPSKLAMPNLLRSEHASIMHSSSIHGVSGCGMDIFSAMKAAVVSLTRTMAVS